MVNINRFDIEVRHKQQYLFHNISEGNFFRHIVQIFIIYKIAKWERWKDVSSVIQTFR